MKILIGIQEIAGYYSLLQKGLVERGVCCKFVQIKSNKFDYNNIPNGLFIDIVNKISKKTYKFKDKSLFLKVIWKMMSIALSYLVFIVSLFNTTHYIFGFSTSFLPLNLDIAILRLLGKKVIFIFHGSDSRPGYLDYGMLTKFGGKPRLQKRFAKEIRIQKRKIDYINRYSNWIVDSPFTSYFHSGKIINWFSIGLPTTDSCLGKGVNMPDKFKILHAPSSSEVKGTILIEEAISKYKGRIEYVKLEGVSNDAVKICLQEVDFIVDQAYSDTPCATLTMEAAALGVPSIVAGESFHDPEYFKATGLTEWPSYVCAPEEIGKSIERFLQEPKLRKKVIEAATRLSHEWNYLKLADRFIKVFNNDIPSEWIFEPEKLSVFQLGCGVKRERVIDAITLLVNSQGIDVLQLNDKVIVMEAINKMLDEVA